MSLITGASFRTELLGVQRECCRLKLLGRALAVAEYIPALESATIYVVDGDTFSELVRLCGDYHESGEEPIAEGNDWPSEPEQRSWGHE